MIKILYQFAKIAERADTVNVSRGLFTPFALNNIWDNPGARRWPKILGRGNGSGKGNSCGRGQRGQLSRSGGGVAVKFEGGQTPITRRLPKWGSKPSNQLYREVNISSLVDRIQQGRIDINKVITIRDLWQAGLFKNTKFGVKLLARGAERISELEKPIQIEVSDASQTAIESIKKHGGKVTCVYRTPLLIHEHLHPERYELELRDPLPPSRAIAALKRIEERGAQTEYRVPRWVENEEKAKQNEQIIQKVEGEVLKTEPLKKEKEKSQKKIQKQQKAEAEKNKDLKKESIIELKEYPVSRKRGVGINKIRHRRQKLNKIIDLKL